MALRSDRNGCHDRAGQDPATWVDPEAVSAASGGIGAATSAGVAVATVGLALSGVAACPVSSTPVESPSDSAAASGAISETVVLSRTAAPTACDAATGFGAGLGGLGIGLLAVSMRPLANSMTCP